jgi:hypothetical protein
MMDTFIFIAIIALSIGGGHIIKRWGKQNE